MYIKLDDIIPNRFQPREIFDEKALNELADSIKNHGVLEPILVRPVGNKYEIIAGERRYKASAIAGLTSIPALVKNMDDKESSIVAYIENAQRKDVSAIESARTAQRILKSNNMTQEELASSLGISQSYLANKIRLLALPLEVQESLMKGEISERHARSLLSVKEEDKQIELLKKIKENKMTVRELEGEIKSMNGVFLNGGAAVPGNNYGNDQNYTSFLNNGSQTPSMTSNGGIENISEPTSNTDFANYLNSYDSNHPVADTQTNDNGFMDYLNGYDASHPVENNENPQPSAQFTTNGNGFMDYLNGYDASHPVEEITDAPQGGEFTTSGNGFMDYLNEYDASHPVEEITDAPQGGEFTTSGNGFMDYLNGYDAGHPVEEITDAPQGGEFTTSGNGFMDYLNSYDSSQPTTDNGNSANTNANNANQNLDPNFTNFLNSYDSQQNTTNTSFAEYLNGYDNNNPVSNVEQIDEVSTPTAPNANGYIEDNPNYVDISKQNLLDSVDAIIDDLKTTITRLKSQSKFKIDTEEINFDDIYQVTIKIDKRDF